MIFYHHSRQCGRKNRDHPTGLGARCGLACHVERLALRGKYITDMLVRSPNSEFNALFVNLRDSDFTEVQSGQSLAMDPIEPLLAAIETGHLPIIMG